MFRKYGFPIIVLSIVLFPLWMYLAWWIIPAKELDIFIMDKTVLTKKRNEHRALNWLLAHERITKSDGSLYAVDEDYYGFFPKEEYKFETKDLKRFSNDQVDSISQLYEMLFYTDVYGVYHNEWYNVGEPDEHSPLIYGGLSPKDIYLMQRMKEQGKLAITEFNLMASPTRPAIRKKVEDLYGIEWSGWVGRTFHTLDSSLNDELPPWIFRMYKKQFKQDWNYGDVPGLLLVHDDERLVILDGKTHLKKYYPVILSDKKVQVEFDVPDKTPFPFWFDITYNKGSNKVISTYQLYTTKKGDSVLENYGIPKNFPAVLEHYSSDYKFYYFAGDYSDNPVTKPYLARFKGIQIVRGMLYDPKDVTDRQRFFWLYYQPMMNYILKRYIDEQEI